MRNHEVSTRQLLLDEKGELREPGWSRRMVQEYRRSMIKAPSFRIKEWDYYLVTGKDFALAFTISDDGYVGLESVSLLLLGEKPWEHTETILIPFPMGKLKLPENSSRGDTVYEDKRLKLSFRLDHHKRKISCELLDFCDQKPLKAEITLYEPEMDSMVIATPWEKKGHFFYNQ